ncbi:MAG: threonylcarbamoyl-AMP synthase [Flavobacteriales bacterium]|nr:threonylcarbamoyl-AMP synthase [Flavobacteriales bacterium]|tara:strand:+ start:11596 stop:12216 length:621 start_codon:yes stop_codon:yes gene_type:complete
MLLKIYPENPNEKKIQQVVECLKDGGVIIYPTDTVYGLGCDIFKQKAVEKIASIKKVNIKKHNFSFICSDLSHLSDFTKPIDRSTYKLMKKALPGAFTFILNANNTIPKLFKNNRKTIGIRVPNHNIPRNIVELLGNPILTTSIRDDDSIVEYSTDPELIYEKYKKQVDIVIDCGYGNLVPSTIVDCSKVEIEIIRQGLGKLDRLL